MVADVEGDNRSHGTYIVQYGAHGRRNQMWCVTQVNSNTDASHFWLNTCGTNLRLGRDSDGWAALRNASNSDRGQMLTYNNSTREVKNGHNQCLDVRGASTWSGAYLLWYGCNGQRNQKWDFRLRNGSTTGSVVNINQGFLNSVHAYQEQQRQAAERARINALQTQYNNEYNTALADWNRRHTAMMNASTNARTCGVVSEDHRCGPAHSNKRCAWQNCSSSGWCGSGDLFTGNAGFNHVAGCWTATDVRIQRQEWAASFPRPVLRHASRRRLRKMSIH